MKVALLTLFISALVIETVSAAKSVQIPSWVRRQLRRSRRRNGDDNTGCNAYVNSRCLFGDCLLADPNYEDIEANFVNDKSGIDYYCMCKQGYETLYPENDPDSDIYKPKEGADWCNVEQDPCFELKKDTQDVCQSTSTDNVCVHTGPNQFECQCSPFWQGAICQQDVNECAPCEKGDEASCPCKNGGRCQNRKQGEDYPLGFQCYCESGTAGQFCEEINDPCGRNPCVAEAEFGGAITESPCRVLKDDEIKISQPATLSGYECTCKPGWGGQDCEMLAGSCAGNPCKGIGQCISDPAFPNFYRCNCFSGYENNVADLNVENAGKFCSKMIDMCTGSNKMCRDDNTVKCFTIGPNLRECVCKAGFTGPLCEAKVNPCYSPGKAKCFNGGECKSDENSGTKFTCDCPAGFGGDLCQEVKDRCLEKDICGETAKVDKCVNLGKAQYRCECKPGYAVGEDKKCSDVDSLCTIEPNVCQYGGKCLLTADITQNFACACDEGTLGDNKAFDVDTNKVCLKGKDDKLMIAEADLSTVKSGVVFKTRGRGVLGNDFVQLNNGAYELKALAKDIFTGDGGVMVLYFHTAAPTKATLLTAVDTTGAWRLLMEIVSSPDGNSFVVRFPNNNPVEEIALPSHSSNGWNSLLIFAKAKDVSVYLNSALVGKKTLTSLPAITKDAKIYIGAGVNAEGKAEGPFFNGGVSNLIYGVDATTFDITKTNLMILNDKECKQCLNLDFKNIYRDSGCMKLDPVPAMEEARRINVKGTEGTFPMASFSYLEDVVGIKKYLDVNPDANIEVRDFGLLFNTPTAINMFFRFRPIPYLAFDDTQKTFVKSTYKEGGQNMLAVSTKSVTKNLELEVEITTELENKKMTVQIAKDPVCKDCVYGVAIKWTIQGKTDSAVDNFVISTLVDGVVTETKYGLKGTWDRESNASPLTIGVDKAHDVGELVICPGADIDVIKRLQDKGEKMTPNAAPPAGPPAPK